MFLISRQTTNFFAPLWTSDGRFLGPERFKNLVRERYLITKHTNTPYSDTGTISMTEKDYLLQFIYEDIKRQDEAVKRRIAEQNNNKKHQRRR